MSMDIDISKLYNMAPGQMFTKLPLGEEDTCPLSMETFSDHIKQHTEAKPSRPWVVAMVKTGQVWKFFDAAMLNAALKNKMENPLNREPIEQVHYIAIKNLQKTTFVRTLDADDFDEDPETEDLDYVDNYIEASQIQEDEESIEGAVEAQETIRGVLYDEDNDQEEVFYWATIRMEMSPNDFNAVQHVAWHYLFGHGVKKDVAKAQDLFVRALSLCSDDDGGVLINSLENSADINTNFEKLEVAQECRKVLEACKKAFEDKKVVKVSQSESNAASEKNGKDEK